MSSAASWASLCTSSGSAEGNWEVVVLEDKISGPARVFAVGGGYKKAWAFLRSQDFPLPLSNNSSQASSSVESGRQDYRASARVRGPEDDASETTDVLTARLQSERDAVIQALAAVQHLEADSSSVKTTQGVVVAAVEDAVSQV